MFRRYLAAILLAMGLLMTAGCLCVELPTFPRLRSLLPGGNGPCPSSMVYDVEGPILETNGPILTSEGGSLPGVAEGTMPQPRIVPQTSKPPSAQPMPYVPPKD